MDSVCIGLTSSNRVTFTENSIGRFLISALVTRLSLDHVPVCGDWIGHGNVGVPLVRCPCLSGLSYDECCEHFHSGATALTPEALMRSRFSAFALGLPVYLLETWHASTRPASLELDGDIHWYRLDILSKSAGTPQDATGSVEFEAFYRGTRTGSQRENSAFVRERGRWFYLGEEARR